MFRNFEIKKNEVNKEMPPINPVISAVKKTSKEEDSQ